jgi:hypothetical protein
MGEKSMESGTRVGGESNFSEISGAWSYPEHKFLSTLIWKFQFHVLPTDKLHVQAACFPDNEKTMLPIVLLTKKNSPSPLWLYTGVLLSHDQGLQIQCFPLPIAQRRIRLWP